MSASNPAAVPTEFNPYGLPMGTVRGFTSVLICSFFWIVLLYPGDNTPHAPLRSLFPAQSGIYGICFPPSSRSPNLVLPALAHRE